MVQNKEVLQQAYVEWLGEYPWSHFVTLTFRNDISLAESEKRILAFSNQLDKKIFGRRSKKQLPVIPFIEKNTSGQRFHLHMLIQNTTSLDDYELKRKIRNTWLRSKVEYERQKSVLSAKKMKFTSPEGDPYQTNLDGSEWFKKVDDSKGLIHYCTKQLKHQKPHDIVLFDGVKLPDKN